MTDPYGRRGRDWVTPGGREAAKKRHPAGKPFPSHLSVVPQDHEDTCECWSCQYVSAHIDDHDDVRPEDL